MEKTLVIEGNIKEIEKRRYSSMGIENLEIKEGVEVIGEDAFFGNNIRKVYLPKSIKKVGDFAFIHNKVEELTFHNNGIKFGRECFSLMSEAYFGGDIDDDCEFVDARYSPIKKLTIIDGDYKILSEIVYYITSKIHSVIGIYNPYGYVQKIDIVNNNISVYEILKIEELANKCSHIRINIIRNNVLIFTNQNDLLTEEQKVLKKDLKDKIIKKLR